MRPFPSPLLLVKGLACETRIEAAEKNSKELKRAFVSTSSLNYAGEYKAHSGLELNPRNLTMT